jgi:phytol kinase
MLFVVVSYLAVFAVLVTAEKLTKHKKIPTEVGRKIPHIAAAVAVALWPHFVSYGAIVVVSILHACAAWYVKHNNMFRHVRSVGRVSYGEFYFAAGVILTAFFSPPAWAFSIAILHLGIADGLAAIVGRAKGRRHRFAILGQTKSVEGSAAFFVSSLLLTGLGLLLAAPTGLTQVWLVVILVPVSATLLEMVGVYGLDNILVPVFVAAILGSIA